MTLAVEPFLGHLLSKCAETVTEGLQKICTRAASDGAFATAFLVHAQGFAVLQELVQKREFSSLALQAVAQLLEFCDNKGVRSSAMREVCRGKSFWVLRRGLTSLSDAMLPVTMASLQLLAVVAIHMPKLVLSQFENNVPLHLACFRLQLPYSQRRVKMARVRLLINLAFSSQATSVESVVCAHGYLTHLLEDAAELLQEGTEAGVEIARVALQIFSERFMSGHILPLKKRSVLLAQKNVIRLLARALDHELVSEYAANIISRIAVDLAESPCDYQVVRLDSEERGMPNYLLFFILRHLRPKRSQVATRLVIFILHQAPDLIRPYFTRISGHLSDSGNTTRISAFTETMATLNVMTRAMLAPIPYHLAAGKARLESVEAKASTFFVMSPENVVEEVCPPWVAEYVHRLIIGSTDILMLLFAIQLTQAILTRAKTVRRLVAKLQNVSDNSEISEGNCQDWEAFNAKVHAVLLKSIPRREEFWHRMTQQLHPMLLSFYGNMEGNRQVDKQAEKVLFIAQRMFVLMESYVEVFNFRMSWLSAVPSFLPTFCACARPIEDALCRGEDVLTAWSAPSISLLCSLFVSAFLHGVSMTKLHHVTMSSTKKGVFEWPILLSVMLWAVKHRERHDEDTQMAMAWVARLIQWTVHSVTVRFVCELEEAFLWLMEMDESTLPCFVHLINYLLQRSLSKSADRIAQELLEGDSGIIVTSSRTFITKNEEKFAPNGNSNSGVGDNEVASSVINLDKKSGTNVMIQKEMRLNNGKNTLKSNNNNDEKTSSIRKNKNTKGGTACENSYGGNDLWTADLKEHLGLFKAVTERVACKWPNRLQWMKETLPFVFTSAHEGQFGKRRIALTMLQAEKVHSVLRPLHDQVFEFCKTLKVPTPTADIEEEIGLLAIVRSGALDELLRRFGNGTKSNNECNDNYDGVVEQGGDSVKCCPSVWCKYPTLGWELAAFFLQRLNELREGFFCNKSECYVGSFCELFACCRTLLKSIAKDATAVTQVLLDCNVNEGNIVGFFVFLLSAMHVMLYGMVECREFLPKTHTILGEGALNALSALLISTYSGTLSITDRIRYATLLTMSYMVQQEGKKCQQKEQVMELHCEKVIVNCATETEREEERGSDNEHCKEVKDLQEETTLRVFSGVSVPESLIKERFVIMNHQSAPNITPEVNMLSLLVDTWTDDEVEAAALHCPARLHNTLLLNTRGGGAGWDVLRCIFPEFSVQDDVPLSFFDATTAMSVTDPRYLLPLIHTVLSMPAEQLPRKNIGTKCIPILLRSLSFTDPQLRRLGATALSVVWTPSGPTRIVVGFARLKLTQLAAKKGGRLVTQQEQCGGDGKEPTWICPRLPAPISAFLVMALRPLADAGHSLHNDIMRFLLKTQEAFANPVPLHQFLTSFPLACITTPLMIKRQEVIRSRTTSQVAIASANEVVQELQSNAPLQLDFIIRLVQFGCQTNGDMMALIRSECLQAVMMLISMVAASSELRLQLLRCVRCVCTTSSAVARQAMEDVHLLSWLLGFAQQLTREYGDTVHMYGEPFFMEVILLLRKLVPLAAASPLYAQQARQQIELIHGVLIANKVTTKDVLDGIEDILQGMRKKTERSANVFTSRKRESYFNERRPVVKVRR